MTFTKSCLCVIGVSILTPLATANLVVGVDNPDTPVYSIDTDTGEATALFTPSDFAADGVWALAADDANGYLYYSGGAELYRVPYATMVPEYVGDFYAQGDLGISIAGLGFDSNTGRLVGTVTSGSEGFYSIDPLTGESTLMMGTTGSSYDFGGIDYDAATDTFYGLNDDITPFGRGLFDIDLFDQTIDHIVDYPLGQTDIDGLAIGQGKAFMVNDDAFGEIFVYNLDTGEYEAPLANPWTESALFSGATWANLDIPGPASLALLGMAGLLVARRRR